MDINLILKEIETTVELENKFINCYTHFKKAYLEYKKKLQNSIEVDIKISSQELISNLELIMAYIVKHQEVKSIYNSYKIILKELLSYREKMRVLSKMSKPLISNDRLGILIDEQLKIQKLVDKINSAFAEQKVNLPSIS